MLRAVRLWLLGTRRSVHWPAVRHHHLAVEPACAACGVTKRVEVHHVLPVHVWPQYELDEGNLITLCRSHHFSLGHNRSWTNWNVYVRREARTMRSHGDTPHT